MTYIIIGGDARKSNRTLCRYSDFQEDKERRVYYET